MFRNIFFSQIITHRSVSSSRYRGRAWTSPPPNLGNSPWPSARRKSVLVCLSLPLPHRVRNSRPLHASTCCATTPREIPSSFAMQRVETAGVRSFVGPKGPNERHCFAETIREIAGISAWPRGKLRGNARRASFGQQRRARGREPKLGHMGVKVTATTSRHPVLYVPYTRDACRVQTRSTSLLAVVRALLRLLPLCLSLYMCYFAAVVPLWNFTWAEFSDCLFLKAARCLYEMYIRCVRSCRHGTFTDVTCYGLLLLGIPRMLEAELISWLLNTIIDFEVNVEKFSDNW